MKKSNEYEYSDLIKSLLNCLMSRYLWKLWLLSNIWVIILFKLTHCFSALALSWDVRLRMVKVKVCIC